MKQNKTSVINIELKSYVKPDIQEMVGRKWVTYGKDNQGFQDIIDRRIGSPTNESVINVYCNLIFGKGIAVKGQEEVYEDLVNVFPKREQRKVLEDYKTFGWFAIELLRGRGTDANRGVAKMMHIPVNKLAKEKANEQGEIDRVYYCYDWTNTRKNKPTPIPIFKGKMSESKMVLVGQPYQAGNFYYADPDYLAAMPYAQLEEEIANFSINHVKNGFSFGAIMNFNNASLLKEEQKDKIERNVKARMTGTENAGRIFLSFNEGKDQETTVSNVDVNDAHSQFEYLSQECISKILTGHGVTSPLLFGMPSAGGFGANADELDTASKLLQDYQISPKQEFFIDTIKPVLELSSLETDLEFIPLRDSYNSTEDNETEVTDETVDDVDENVELSGTYNDYPQAAKNNAKRALKWAEKNGWGSCGTSVGKKRASQIANGENLSRDTIARMASFKRHQQHKDVPYSEGCGGLMWDAWGGSAGVNWAISKLKEIDAKLYNKLNLYNTTEVINEGAEVLIDLADDDMDGWECIDERDVDYDLEDELDNEILKLNNHKPSVLDKLIQFVSTGVARPNAKSEQDKNIDGVKYKVRYEYYPKLVSSNSRDFCRKMVAADKLYRKEDIMMMEDRVVNAGWGANGADKYSIWLYKGGGGCHHRWRRKTFKFTGRGKGDTKSPLAPTISTNKAEKEGYRVRNPKEVAMRPKDMKNEGFLKPRYIKSSLSKSSLLDEIKMILNSGFDPNQPRDKAGRWTKSGDVNGECSFNNWFDNSKVVDEFGKPKVFYHGTTHEFDEFTKDRANIENDMGKGFYFSSSYDDVVMNYDDVYGADLSNRIERLAEQLEYSKDISYEDAKKLAQKRLVGGVNKVLEVYISLQNPAIIGGNNETYIDYNWDEEEGESGLFVDFYNELQYVASQYYDVDLSNWISNGFWEGGGLSDFIKAVKGSEGLAYATDEKGNLAASEIIRETLENMGFDGIIDNTVSSKFKNMEGLYNDTQHVIAFESNQIKSTDNKTWCKDNVKINLSSWKNK